MTGRDESEREFDLRWADDAEHKEPSARARMLAARWKHNPPGPVPFRPDPDLRSSGRRSRSRSRSSWVSTALVFGCVAAVIVLLGYINFRAP
ncbi:SCO2583/SCO2584 N-terminal domain-containing protein [Streptomyces sp. NPDC002611]